MRAVSGSFAHSENARAAVRQLCDLGLPADSVAVLEPGGNGGGFAHPGHLALVEALSPREIHALEHALYRGRSIVVALAEDTRAQAVESILCLHGAETIDAARDAWWAGLRHREREHYHACGRDFAQDEAFYRLGFESALRGPMRGREYDQVLSEMSERIEELKQQYPGREVEEAFRRGYERGEAHVESGRSKASHAG